MDFESEWVQNELKLMGNWVRKQPTFPNSIPTSKPAGFSKERAWMGWRPSVWPLMRGQCPLPLPVVVTESVSIINSALEKLKQVIAFHWIERHFWNPWISMDVWFSDIHGYPWISMDSMNIWNPWIAIESMRLRRIALSYGWNNLLFMWLHLSLSRL